MHFTFLFGHSESTCSWNCKQLIFVKYMCYCRLFFKSFRIQWDTLSFIFCLAIHMYFNGYLVSLNFLFAAALAIHWIFWTFFVMFLRIERNLWQKGYNKQYFKLRNIIDAIIHFHFISYWFWTDILKNRISKLYIQISLAFLLIFIYMTLSYTALEVFFNKVS